MSKTQTLKYKIQIQAQPEEVYAAFTHASALTEWLCNVAEADAHIGGRLYVWWNSGYYASGEYTQLRPGEKIAFSWHGRGEPGITQMRITLKPAEDGALLTLTHSEIGVGKAWSQAVREFKKGWKTALENLQSVLETGQDLRFVNRPLLGLSGLEPVTPELAAAENLPVTSGVRITGVLEGMGAEAAGLQRGDVLVKLGGKKIAVLDDFGSALSGRSAGETVKAVYYRGDEKQTVKLTLTRRPLPEIPATAEALAQKLAARNLQANRQLFAALKHTSDADASFHPAGDEWSVKETLAHLIASERDRHTWLAGLLDGHEAHDIYQSNLRTRIQAIISAYPSVALLRRELTRNQDEVVALAHNLPAEFVARKGTFWRVGYWLLSGVDHLEGHLPQIQATLAEARKTLEPHPTKEGAKP